MRVGHAVYPHLEFREALPALTRKVSQKKVPAPEIHGLGEPQGSPATALRRIISTRVGRNSSGLATSWWPNRHRLHGPRFRPHAERLGVPQPDPLGLHGLGHPGGLRGGGGRARRRTVLITGEGSHQFTVQEISQLCRYGLKPIIFCLNNQGYTIERLLCQDPLSCYNEIAQWNYQQFPGVFGCSDWFTARVTTNGELEAAMAQAETCGTGRLHRGDDG